ncbi:MAG: MerR family transcriptional regulator [Bacteroidota bacterium]
MEIKHYSVKEVSSLSGVTVRTLHHYDKIGLLTPKRRAESGYRYYGEEELLRLQQILFYKELGFPLKEISEVLDDPDFDLLTALESHRKALEERQERISTLLKTIDYTISEFQQEKIMKDPKKLYEGLPKEFGTTYRDEAIDKWGKETIVHAEQELLKLRQEDFRKLKEELDEVNAKLFELKETDVESEEVQALITRHYAVIRAYWGTSQKEDSQAEAYAGLGTLYVNDDRYTSVNGEAQPEFARFLEKAMKYFADTRLK